MEIKYKFYPYPVLSYFSDDYNDKVFNASIEMVRDGHDLRLDFVSELSSDSIKKLISEGKASYVYHLECAQTGFRDVIITQSVEERYRLDKRLVCGRIQVCPFVVAREDLHDYSSTEFHSDYAGFSFDIEAGCVIAVGKQTNFDIYKEIDDIANLPSIFSVIRNPSPEVREMIVDYSGNKIIVKLPFNDFPTYKQLNKDANNIPMLNALTIIPALTYVLGEIKQLDSDGRSEFCVSGWYRTIQKSLLKTFDIDIESDFFDDIDTLELAQKLINSPIPEAFTLLCAGEESDGDE